jgi:GTP-binding protein Era
MKSGFVSIVGKPNVGKSTLLNAIIDQKLSITSRKPQTTRKRILGIYNSDDSQIIFLDTPGIINPEYLLHKKMFDYIMVSIEESDQILFVVDCYDYNLFKLELDDKIVKTLQKKGVPLLLIINKIDLLENRNTTLRIINEMKEYKLFKEIIPISAKDKDNVKELLEVVKTYLPEHPAYFDKNDISNASIKFFISEIVREKIFLLFHDEIPYSSEVIIDKYIERKTGKDYVAVTVIVERESQRRIIIGKKAESLKRVGERSRADIEKFIGKGVYLKIFVTVKENWRDEENTLRSFGY